MRRILETYRFEQGEWSMRGKESVEAVMVPGEELPMFASELEAVEGRKAYAAYQVYVWEQMEEECRRCWKEIPVCFLDSVGAICLNDETYNFV